MKKLFILLMILCLAPCVACAEDAGLIPAGAIPEAEAGVDAYTIPETGERIVVSRDDSGKIIGISGTNETCIPHSAPEAGAAQAVIAEAFPGAGIISSADDSLNGAPALRINFLAEDYCGYAILGDGRVLAREITFGPYMDGDTLTYEGAKAAILLHRPGFKIDEIEKDNDDGLILYEGEGYLNGAEYEFEMDIHTGRLLQWERD